MQGLLGGPPTKEGAARSRGGDSCTGHTCPGALQALGLGCRHCRPAHGRHCYVPRRLREGGRGAPGGGGGELGTFEGARCNPGRRAQKGSSTLLAAKTEGIRSIRASPLCPSSSALQRPACSPSEVQLL